MKLEYAELFAGLQVLVVEDEPLIAMALAEELEAAGAEVIGPADTVERALDLMKARHPDAGILDIGLRSASSYPVAGALLARGTPFVFTSGFGADIVPEAYRSVSVVAKPVQPAQVLAALAAECGGTRKR